MGRRRHSKQRGMCENRTVSKHEAFQHLGKEEVGIMMRNVQRRGQELPGPGQAAPAFSTKLGL